MSSEEPVGSSEEPEGSNEEGEVVATDAGDAVVGWEVFARSAPDLAARIQDRFAANLHHVIGTVRSDGAPRLSGTEVRIEAGSARIGMMAGSRKLADVRRDPRVELHSAPLEEDLAAGDAKLTGRLVELDGGVLGEPGAGAFELRVNRVALIRVDGDHLEIATWSPATGEQLIRRS